MSPEPLQPNSENTHAEIAFVQQALADADRSERTSRVIVGVLAILAVAVFVWMHMRMFPPETLGGLMHSILRSTSSSKDASCCADVCHFSHFTQSCNLLQLYH